jgi:hypothetical protein
MARGGLLVLPILWLAAFSESVRATGAAVGLPDLSGARSASVGRAALGAAAENLARGGDRGARVTAKFVASPGASLAAASAIASDVRMRALQADAGFWRDVRAGEVESALARPTFRELARDGTLRAQLADLGLIGEAAAVDAEMFREEMGSALTEISPRLRQLESDPAFQSLLADEELRERARAGDLMALLGDPRIQQLAARLAQ